MCLLQYGGLVYVRNLNIPGLNISNFLENTHNLYFLFRIRGTRRNPRIVYWGTGDILIVELHSLVKCENMIIDS